MLHVPNLIILDVMTPMVLEAVSSIRIPRTRYAVLTGTHLNFILFDGCLK